MSPSLKSNMASSEDEQAELSERDLIKHYFDLGYNYVTILSQLERYHNVNMSMRTLKRRLNHYGLKRKKNEVDVEQIRMFIQEIIAGPGSMWGYRSVWHALRIKYKVHVPCKLVATLLRELDPEGVNLRRQHKFSRRRYVSHGPNYCWHIDGYDKLKPYGFPIHGAIDGYSRKILWMEVVRSNNDPKIPAQLYLDCVKREGVCPRLLWSDCGTENGITAAMQCFFRKDGHDELAGEKAHRYGNSHANQRIEAFWSFYRRTRSSWWIDYFKNLVQSGMLELGNILHMECLWFCFAAVLQRDIDLVVEHWNTHSIRSSRYNTVAGKPDVLYYLPENSGGVSSGVHISNEEIQEVQHHCEREEDDNDYEEYFHYVMETERLYYPNSPEESFVLYGRLLEIAQ